MHYRVSDFLLGFCKKNSRFYGSDLKKTLASQQKTRHYYTHYDPKREPKTAKEDKLFWLTRDLQVVLQLCLLKELGFGKQRLKKYASVYSKLC